MKTYIKRQKTVEQQKCKGGARFTETNFGKYSVAERQGATQRFYIYNVT